MPIKQHYYWGKTPLEYSINALSINNETARLVIHHDNTITRDSIAIGKLANICVFLAVLGAFASVGITYFAVLFGVVFAVEVVMLALVFYLYNKSRQALINKSVNNLRFLYNKPIAADASLDDKINNIT